MREAGNVGREIFAESVKLRQFGPRTCLGHHGDPRDSEEGVVLSAKKEQLRKLLRCESSSEGSGDGVPVPEEGLRVGHAGLDAAQGRSVPGTSVPAAGLGRVDREVGRREVVAQPHEAGGVAPSTLLEGGVGFDLDDEIGLVAQVDSTEHHFTTPDQVVETERQHRAYRSAGLHVIGIRPSRVRRDREGLYRDVLDARRIAAALPDAEVRWSPDLP